MPRTLPRDTGPARRAGGVARTVNAGFVHHQAGRLARAEALYRKALEKDPDHVEALHLLGVVAYQRGDSASAIALIGRALPTLEEFAEVHLNLGNALREAGRTSEAVDSYRHAIALEPDHGIAHSNLARALNDQGLFEAGLRSAERAIALNPEFGGAHVNVAAALLSLGRFAEAESPLRRALELMPDRAEIHHDLASTLARLGRIDEAVASYQRALVLRPDFALAHYNLALALMARGTVGDAVTALRRVVTLEPGVLGTQLNCAAALWRLGQFAEAESALRRALDVDPNRAETHRDLGSVLAELGRLDEALAFHDRALALRPDDATMHCARARTVYRAGDLAGSEAGFRRALALAPDASIHNHLGVVLQRAGKLDEARATFDQALALGPNQAQTHNNLGAALVALGRVEEGIAHYHRALTLEPKRAETYNNLGNVLERQARHDEAMRCYERALALRPDYAEARFNRSLGLLLRGDLARGWPEYEWRWRYTAALRKREFGRPAWSGESLGGKTILVYAEQGLGDTLHFVRLVSVLAARGARVVLEVPPPLAALLRASELPATVIPQGAVLPTFDVQQALLSLPGVLGLTEATIPATVPYLTADPDRAAAWRTRLGARGFRVGVVWQGRPNVDVDRGRSFPLHMLAPIAALPGVRLISLQKNGGLDQLDALPEGMRVETVHPELDAGPDAFLDTAAVMMSRDLVITSDTSIAHLAGALARPVWIALKHVPDWRWMLEREDTPWYPTARLFRQGKPGDWGGVFACMAAELARVLTGERERLRPAAVPGRTPPSGAGVGEPAATVLKQCRHGRMLFLRGDRYIGRSLDLYGEFSEGEAELFARLLRPGDAVVEVGANIGAHTVTLAKLVGAGGHVVAFEPQRVIFQLLCANLALNELFNVHAHHAAVGRGRGTIRVPPIDYMSEGNFGGVAMAASGPGEPVPLLRLDDVALPAPRLVKIDVEGMESDVLAGARETIARFRPLLYVENDRPARSREVVALVDELGYTMWWHRPRLYNPDNFAGNPDNAFEGIVSLNLLCVPKEGHVDVTGLPWISRAKGGVDLEGQRAPSCHPTAMRDAAHGARPTEPQVGWRHRNALNPVRATICLLTYGDHLPLFRRCFESVCGSTPLSTVELRIGVNAAPRAFEYLIRTLGPGTPAPENLREATGVQKYIIDAGQGSRVRLWNSPVNLYKEPMCRLMYHDTPLEGDYVVWFDDDSFVEPGWWEALTPLFDRGIDYIGQEWWVDYLPGQAEMIRSQPWYRGIPFDSRDGKQGCAFMTGAFMAVKTSRIREANFPDTAFHWKGETLKQYGGDTLLGDIARQLGWTRARHDRFVKVNVDLGGRHPAPRRGGTGRQFGSDVDVVIR